MPLHPQAQALIDMMEASGINGISPETRPDELRALMAAMVVPSEIPIEHVENREIAGPGGAIPVRVYRPAGEPPFPVLVYYHGGGWVIGSIETHDGTCRGLANGAGCVVVSVDYRLAPEHKFPAAVDDAFSAFEWVVEHAAELGGDPARLAVAGDSAGGHLAAVTAIHARDAGIPLAMQMLVYPALEYEFERPSMHENAEGFFLSRYAMQWFYGHYLTDPTQGTDWRVSPRYAPDHTDLAPAYVVTAEYDPLRDQGRAYAELLHDAGVATQHREYAGVFHGFFAMTALLDTAREAEHDACVALRDALGAPARA